jgi:hypothetical protein
MKGSPYSTPVLPRGRVATWTREQLEKLSTDDLRSLRANAEGRKETEVAALCTEILESRPARARKPA